MSAKPYLVVRAHVDEAVLAEFERWYQEVHLPNMLKIPGILRAYRSTCCRSGFNWATLYEFSDEAIIQDAFASPEAARARQDWQRWLPHVSEISVEVYIPQGPTLSYHYWN